MVRMKHLDELNRELYDTGQRSVSRRVRTVAPTTQPASAAGWNHEQNIKPKRRRSTIELFFWGSLGFAVISFLALVVMLGTFKKSISNSRIDIQVIGPTFVDSGQKNAYQVSVVNKNSATIESASVVLSYATESSQGDVQKTEAPRAEVGRIESGREVTADFPLVLYGLPGDIRTIQVQLEYRIAGSRAVFVKQTELQVTIASSPVQVSIDMPETITRNQTFSATVTVTSHSKDQLTNIGVQLEYPRGMRVDTIDPEPSVGKYFWVFPAIDSGDIRVITISGVVSSEVQDVSSLKVYVGQYASGGGEKLLSATFASLAKRIQISDSFLKAELLINGSTESTISLPAGADIDGVVRITNTSSVPYRGVTAVVEVDGTLVDLSDMRASNGFFEQSKKTITWSSATGNSDLGQLNPGDSVELSFGVSQKPIPATATNIPTALFTLGISGFTVDGGRQDAASVDTLTVQRIANISLLQDTLYYSSHQGNTGPIPPTVGQETVYTIVWRIPKTDVSLEQVEVSTTLPQYVKWQNHTSSTAVHYSDTTRTVTWTVGGVSGSDGELSGSFLVGITPDSSHVGVAPNLTSEISVTGFDTASQKSISTRKPAHTTRLRNDTSANDGVVVAGGQ